jgi:hypothetical protein
MHLDDQLLLRVTVDGQQHVGLPEQPGTDTDLVLVERHVLVHAEQFEDTQQIRPVDDAQVAANLR